MALTWEAKVFAVADAAVVADALETNWKHIWTKETFPMLRAEQMNLKPSLNLSLHTGSTGDAFMHMQVPQVVQELLLITGISDKSLFEINSEKTVGGSWMLMNWSVAKASVQNMSLFFKWQCKNDSKEGWTIFKKPHPDKSYNMTSIGFIATCTWFD